MALLGIKHLHQAEGFRKYDSPEELAKLMESIDWANAPWLGSHVGAGICAPMLLTGTASDEWEEAHFAWLEASADPITGLWRKGMLEGAPRFHHLASTFHYTFN